MRLSVLLIALCSCVSLTASPARAQDLTDFTLPSGNIGCTYVPAGGTATYEARDGGPELICSRVEPSYVTVSMTASSAPLRYDNPGEQGCCAMDVILTYGSSLQLGPFTCAASKAGLLCTGPHGHSLAMSRARVDVQ